MFVVIDFIGMTDAYFFFLLFSSFHDNLNRINKLFQICFSRFILINLARLMSCGTMIGNVCDF